ncbi:hypothetical protein Nepgr_024878 [Nepenthes gracilis]|uniref:Uncharacterized protein n=1 Tax=Nepenthes gracilis TaxID=150966 RepID=A0AAD3T4V4_NEPGR|nr:hypothetical protein Nepgr_024878 [Nepenthes gracilis]
MGRIHRIKLARGRRRSGSPTTIPVDPTHLLNQEAVSQSKARSPLWSKAKLPPHRSNEKERVKKISRREDEALKMELNQLRRLKWLKAEAATMKC